MVFLGWVGLQCIVHLGSISRPSKGRELLRVSGVNYTSNDCYDLYRNENLPVLIPGF